MSANLIYLDNNSTTPTDPRVLEAMIPYFSEFYGNPASTHKFGNTIDKHVKNSREQIADLLQCDTSELIFTSGATESINIAIIGFALKNIHNGKHIVTVKTEHKAVLDSINYLNSIGFEITYLDVQEDGNLNLPYFADAIKSDTVLVCVMLSNNEIGTIHPIKKIADIIHDKGSALFCDATQAVGKIEIEVKELNVDMLSFSGHKFYGPKGVGGLYVKDLKKNKSSVQPLQYGGGHEQGIRSGTLNVPGIIGLGKASELAKLEMDSDQQKISRLRDLLESELLKIPDAFINGAKQNRMYNVTNICFPGLDANAFINRLPDIAASNGSACTAAIVEPSHVLRALGLTDENSNSSIRFSLGKFNSEEEIKVVSPKLKELIVNDPMRYAKIN